MAQFESDSVILRTHDLSDADRIVVAITKDHGVIRGVAKGAKRLKSKFGSSLEPFSFVRLSYYRKETVELATIDRSDLIRSNFRAAGDFEFLMRFTYVADLITSLSLPDDPNELLYRLVKSCIEVVADDPTASAATVLYFETWILKLSGLLPDWGKCQRCSTVFTETEETVLVDAESVYCRTCKPKAAGKTVSYQVRELFQSAKTLGPADFSRRFVRDAEVIDEASALTRIKMERSLGRKLRSPAEVKRVASR
jgi:DNA repair protein RecO (recombination protein O)